jgi:hypothetical protein
MPILLIDETVVADGRQEAFWCKVFCKSWPFSKKCTFYNKQHKTTANAAYKTLFYAKETIKLRLEYSRIKFFGGVKGGGLRPC